MIIRKETHPTEKRSNMREGAGIIELMHLQSADELSHARLFSHLTLPQGSSIGPHIHANETEYYYILRGTGIVEEADGNKAVGPGDLVVTGGGASHSIENTGSEPLEFIALILLDD